MIRGAIGHVLLRRFCSCDGERHRSDCLYAELFETAAGNAFVITPPKQAMVAPGEPFAFRVTLLRPTPEREKAILEAVELALMEGLTNQHTSCRLMSVSVEEPSREKLGKLAVLHLLSPWFVKRGGKHVTASQCGAHTLLIGIAQRQRNLRARTSEYYRPDE